MRSHPLQNGKLLEVLSSDVINSISGQGAVTVSVRGRYGIYIYIYMCGQMCFTVQIEIEHYYDDMKSTDFRK
jgi:hypothetical protein